MDDRGQLNPLSGEHAPDHSDRGTFAAWLADYGVVLVPSTEGSNPAGDKQADSPTETRPTPAYPFSQPDAALLIRLPAQKLWCEGRSNPLDWLCRSWLGDWKTDDRVTWRTTDGVWLAQLQRSANGRRVMLYLWHKQTLVGYQDDTSWHPASTRTRARQPRPVQHSLPLPLPLPLAG